jgi:hypothetical protein
MENNEEKKASGPRDQDYLAESEKHEGNYKQKRKRIPTKNFVVYRTGMKMLH